MTDCAPESTTSQQPLLPVVVPSVVEQLQDELDALNANITKVGSRIRELKKNNASTSGDTVAMDELMNLIQSLQELKLQASQKSESITKSTLTSSSLLYSNANTLFQRKVFDDLMIRKMFIIPSFEIHGGVKGLFDLGPPACSLKVGCLFSVTSTGYIQS
jgi:glycyl-tRNA synthetase